VKEVILDLELLFLIEIKLMLADFNRKGFFFLLKFNGQFFLLLSDLGNETKELYQAQNDFIS
jgi:hypothetical protein